RPAKDQGCRSRAPEEEGMISRAGPYDLVSPLGREREKIAISDFSRRLAHCAAVAEASHASSRCFSGDGDTFAATIAILQSHSTRRWEIAAGKLDHSSPPRGG